MGTTKKEAYVILELTPDCKLRDIERNYKRLALEWYPQKHNYSALANEKFKQISHAYKVLTSQEKKVYDLTMSEMMSLFQHVFFKSSASRFPEVHYDDDSDYTDDSFDDEELSDDCDFIHQALGTIKKFEQSNETALKNAEELIAEEEKEKKKAEKRRAKKKRRKQKKKQEKISTTEEPKKLETEKSNEEQKSKESHSSGSEEEHLDPSSAFVVGAASKSKINAITPKLRKNEPIVPTLNGNAQSHNVKVKVEDIDPVTLQSRQLAIRGNQMAAMAEYQAAIDLFTEAIKLDPTDFRYFGNRSYCYDRTEQYNRALKDADRAIGLAPNWPKGYFRKGRALAGLQKFDEAEECFREVTKLDKDCAEAFQEMYKARTLRIMEMGFSRQVAEVAAQKYDTLEAAVNALVAETSSSKNNSHSSANGVTSSFGAGRASLNGDESSDIYYSEEEQEDFYSKPRSNSAQAADDKMDPRNPYKQTSLWVGNVKKEATEKTLTALFSKFGEVVSIRVLPDRRCAFVNYKNARAASRAMESVQGFEFLGENLKIRFPDHQHGIGQPAVTVLKKKTSVAKTKPKGSPVEFKGPVNGDECFFWRQGGCIHGEKCRYRHVAKHKGIDLK